MSAADTAMGGARQTRFDEPHLTVPGPRATPDQAADAEIAHASDDEHPAGSAPDVKLLEKEPSATAEQAAAAGKRRGAARRDAPHKGRPEQHGPAPPFGNRGNRHRDDNAAETVADEMERRLCTQAPGEAQRNLLGILAQGGVNKPLTGKRPPV